MPAGTIKILCGPLARNLKILCDYARMLAAPFLTPHLNPGLSVAAAPVLSWLVARGAIMAPGWALCSRDTGQSLPAFKAGQGGCVMASYPRPVLRTYRA